MNIISGALLLIVASACAIFAGMSLPRRWPSGFLAALAVAVLGACLGFTLIGPLQSLLAGAPLIPAIVGFGLMVFGFALAGDDEK